MPENTTVIANLIAESVKGKLSRAGKSDLEIWTASADENKLLVSSLCNKEQRNSKIAQFNLVDKDAIWNNFRARARSESGYHLEGRPTSVVPVSFAVKSLLIMLAVLALICVVTMFYMTILNVKNHRYPLKSIQRSFRL